MIIDSRERKSIPYLMDHFPDAQITELMVGDVYENGFLIEIKIGQDVHDYARMADEFYRMSMREDDLHAIYVGHDIGEYKIFVNYCNQYGVWAHLVENIEALVKKVDKIVKGKYTRGKPFIKKPSCKLSPFARMLASFNGITEEKAIDMADMYRCPHLMDTYIHDGKIDGFNKIYGKNKNGSEKAIVKKFRDFWEGSK